MTTGIAVYRVFCGLNRKGRGSQAEWDAGLPGQRVSEEDVGLCGGACRLP